MSTMLTKKTLATAVLFFSSCLLVLETKVLADTSVFPEEQIREIPVNGYFLNEVEGRCNAGRETFCHRIKDLTNRQREEIRRQEKETRIPFLSTCGLNQSRSAKHGCSSN